MVCVHVEIRSTKSETNSKHETSMTETLSLGDSLFGTLGFLSFEFVSDFEIRVSSFHS